MVKLFNNSHTILGAVVCGLMVFQATLGCIHHRHFVKHKTRGATGHGHRIFGRILIFMAIVNGGMGLEIVHAPESIVIAYAVNSGVMIVLYIIMSSYAATRSLPGGVEARENGP